MQITLDRSPEDLKALQVAEEILTLKPVIDDKSYAHLVGDLMNFREGSTLKAIEYLPDFLSLTRHPKLKKLIKERKIKMQLILSPTGFGYMRSFCDRTVEQFKSKYEKGGDLGIIENLQKNYGYTQEEAVGALASLKHILKTYDGVRDSSVLRYYDVVSPSTIFSPISDFFSRMDEFSKYKSKRGLLERLRQKLGN